MTVVINDLDVVVESPQDDDAPRASAPVGLTPHHLDELARHLDARRDRVRAD